MMDWNTFVRGSLSAVSPYKPGLREEQVRAIAQTDHIYKLSSNESPYPPFPSAIAAMQEAVCGVNEYPDGSAHALTEALAKRYGVAPAEIIVGNGSNELIDDIAHACLEPGDNVVYCWPSFVVYRSSALIAGAEPRELALDEHGDFDLDALLAAIDENTKIVYVCTPNNPTGTIVTDKDFARFWEAVPSHVLVIVDAAYDEFIDDPRAVNAVKYFDGTRPLVILKTFSKMYALAGIRCGYGIAPAPIIEAINKVREPFNVNSISQAGALASLDDTIELERRRALNSAGKQRLYECFERLGLKYTPSEANFVLVSVPDAKSTFDALLQRGIIVRFFPVTAGLRVGVGSEEGISATIAAFNELFG